MPIGMPGCPEFAACTASMASARSALAMSCSGAGGSITAAIEKSAIREAGSGEL
jgi:hypothetical protein